VVDECHECVSLEGVEPDEFDADAYRVLVAASVSYLAPEQERLVVLDSHFDHDAVGTDLFGCGAQSSRVDVREFHARAHP
jgi:hypothetical protein